jgi:RHH-type transcriptional regulator, rel operon repressor / antitoxin RelB
MSYISNNQLTTTLSVRVSPEVRSQLENLSDATRRTKSFLAAEAIEYYLATQAWQINSIKQSLIKADSKDAKFIEHSKVVDWLNSWGTKEEGAMQWPETF